MQVEVQHVRALHQASIPSLLSDSVKALCDRIDSFLEATCFQCFGNFTNIDERRLLTLADMRTLIAMVKQQTTADPFGQKIGLLGPPSHPALSWMLSLSGR